MIKMIMTEEDRVKKERTKGKFGTKILLLLVNYVLQTFFSLSLCVRCSLNRNIEISKILK